MSEPSKQRAELRALAWACSAITGLLAVLHVLAVPAVAFERTEQRAPCADADPLRRPFFGDLHVHTTLSFDAWAQGTLNMPRDAYRFARGESVGIQPYDASGKPVRTVRLRRPLDFAMVSDHAEMLGETALCRTSGSPSYDRFTCEMMRRWPRLGYMIVNSQWGASGHRSANICGNDGVVCREAALSPWRTIQEAAEEYYDRSDRCEFTTFVGFEWSGTRIGMVHRNVVFRNERVLDSPPNAVDDRNDETVLWATLQGDCIEASSGCDALAIPHNSNLSEGSMFWDVAPNGAPLDAALARRRRDIEPLIEMTQHKGDSECRDDGSDPLCDFETLRFGNVAGHASALYRDPVPPGVYVREGLLAGLSEQQRIGVNPYKLGFIGSTDTHLGTPGLVDEDMFVGHAAGNVTARLEVPVLPDHPVWNPGGLAVLWAEENSRDALFEAMRRREAYGTSGPRMVVRFFGGWHYEATMCGARDFAAQGYAGGVPMGGDLPPTHGGGNFAPTFAVWALKDPGTSDFVGTPLQRVQIVKGWIDRGETHQRVFDVAGRVLDEQRVNLATCESEGVGSDELCTVWRDPDFDPKMPSFYYARVVENPSCRWSWRACLEAGVDDCASPPAGPLAACCDPEIPKTIQERAWTSPIWYTPASSPAGAAP